MVRSASGKGTGDARGRRPSASSTYLPEARTLRALDAAATSCRACPLGDKATQTVFGEGREGAALFLVGEQPGNDEDLAGKPFVGPAGRLLDGALDRARVVRTEVYVTNAVKHFKFEPRGKRRIHSKPNATEVQACHAWLEAELAAVQPRVIVCLGATAAKAVMGNDFSVTKERGRVQRTADGVPMVATWHPSAILRAPTHDARKRLEEELVADLAEAARASRAEPSS